MGSFQLLRDFTGFTRSFNPSRYSFNPSRVRKHTDVYELTRADKKKISHGKQFLALQALDEDICKQMYL